MAVGVGEIVGVLVGVMIIAGKGVKLGTGVSVDVSVDRDSTGDGVRSFSCLHEDRKMHTNKRGIKRTKNLLLAKTPPYLKYKNIGDILARSLIKIVR